MGQDDLDSEETGVGVDWENLEETKCESAGPDQAEDETFLARYAPVTPPVLGTGVQRQEVKTQTKRRAYD